MSQSREEQLQQLLCAYVLGEATDAERREIEQELEKSESLREEKARFESTIALVTGVYEGDEQLSNESVQELVAAASRGGGRVIQGPWFRRPMVRMAAGLVVVVGAAAAINFMADGARQGEAHEDVVARLDADSQSRKNSEALYRADDLKDRAKSEASAGRWQPESPPEEQEEPVLRDIEVKVAQGAAITPAPNGDVERSATGLAAGQVAQDPSTLGLRAEDVRNELTRESSSVDASLESFFEAPDAEALPASEEAVRVVDQLDSAGFPVSTVSPPVQSEAVGGGGGGALGSATTSPAAPARGVTATAGGKLRSRRPALKSSLKKVKSTLSSAPSSPGAGGPSTPGPSSPRASVPGSARTPAPSRRLESLGGADEFFLDGAYAADEVVLYFEEAEEADLDDGEVEVGRRIAFDLELDKRGYLGERRRQRQLLTPDELEATVRLSCDRIITSCRRLPDEKPRDMFFRYYGDNPFELASVDKLSTFAADVDTSSYVLVRNYLKNKQLPTKAQVRTEEFVNYFRPDVQPPTEGVFRIETELAPSRFSDQAGRWMMRVAIRGRDVAREERKPLNLTFVTDTSGSMEEQNRMELVKHALRLLLTQLDARDSISIVGFSNEARLILPMTSVANRGVIESAIFGMNPDGGTNAEAGLMMGYEVAGAALGQGSHNRVVLLSDGVANMGQVDQDRINEAVKHQRERGIYLNTIGVGMNNHNDVFLEQLANKGDGLANYIDDEKEARRALVENFTGAFEPIARDVKIQVEFDATQVYRYRQLGYENRSVADADFRNDAVDAGEIGAGHQVVCLYEIETSPGFNPQAENALATVRVRYKQPTGAGRQPLEDSATEIEHLVQSGSASSFEGTSAGYRRSVLAAQFAEVLRRSTHARGDSLDDLIAASVKLAPEIQDPDFQELVDLVKVLRAEIVKRFRRRTDLGDCVENLRRHHLMEAELEMLGPDKQKATMEDLEKLRVELEQRIEELVRRRVESEQEALKGQK